MREGFRVQLSWMCVDVKARACALEDKAPELDVRYMSELCYQASPLKPLSHWLISETMKYKLIREREKVVPWDML